MLRIRPLRWSLALVLLAPACEDDHDHDHDHTGSGAVCKEGSTLTWASFGEGFMADYCTSCHASTLSGAARRGAPSDHNFDTVDLVREQLDHIDEHAAAGPDAINTAMPIGSPVPSEAERRLLGEWLACGAP